MARPAARLPTARRPRRNPRRSLCRRLFGRALRETRRRKDTNTLLSISGADPLNLVGILTPGPRLPALTGNRLLYRDGVPVAMLSGGEVRFLEELDPAAEWEANKALLRARFAPASRT